MQDLLDLKLDGKTVLKVLDQHGQQEFALCKLTTPKLYVNAMFGIYIDFEVSPDGVHGSLLLNQKVFDRGRRVYIATPEEVSGLRQFSYPDKFDCLHLKLEAARE